MKNSSVRPPTDDQQQNLLHRQIHCFPKQRSTLGTAQRLDLASWCCTKSSLNLNCDPVYANLFKVHATKISTHVVQERHDLLVSVQEHLIISRSQYPELFNIKIKTSNLFLSSRKQPWNRLSGQSISPNVINLTSCERRKHVSFRHRVWMKL